MLTPLSLAAFRERLLSLMETCQRGAVVFDADGTLWRHDVGSVVFNYALQQRVLREDARSELTFAARKHDVRLAAGADANAVAAEVARAYSAHAFDERAAAEIQVWAYAGLTTSDFRELTRQALRNKNHSDGVHTGVVELAEWVRQQGFRSLIVSASPRWVVEEAAAQWGFGPDDIAAGDPCMSADDPPLIRCGMAAPLPYGPDKVTAGRALLGDQTWLAALGDSAFDLDMFREALLAGGIGNKPQMLAGLAPLPHGFRVDLEA